MSNRRPPGPPPPRRRLLAAALLAITALAAPAAQAVIGTCDGGSNVDVEATGGTALAGYATLGAAFTAINAGTHTGTIDIEICADTAEGATSAVLNASGSGAASYTAMTIKPVGGATRTISGATTAGSPLIDFNGADGVTVDGLNTGGNSLTISNTTVSTNAATSTIRFIADATGNTVTNATILGSSSAAVATASGTILFSTGTATGNDNNTISNNNIGPAGANLPSKAIVGSGSVTSPAIGNSGIIINNNNVFDFFAAAVTSAGIATLGGCNTWSITNNRFYQTGTRTWTTGSLHAAINIGNSTTNGAQGFTITGNIVGFASNTQTGVYTLTGAGAGAKFLGILFNGTSTGTTTNVNTNTVAAVSMTGVTANGTSTNSPFTAILFQEGNGITNGNIIGSQSATGSLVFSTTTTSATDVYGIYNFSSNAWTSNTNSIGGISVTNLGASGTFLLFGMRAFTASTTTWTAASNNVGGTVANSIQLTATGTSSQVEGLFTSNAPTVLTSNAIRNLTTNIGTGTTTAASVIGINLTSTTPNHTLSQNAITNLSNTNATGASVVTGIQFTGSTANVVERNLIYGLTVATTSTAAEVNGIRVAGGTTVYRNNMIAVGAGIGNAIGTGSTTGGVNGITEPAGTNSFFHNSVYVGGAPTAGVGPSYAFNSSVTTNTRSFRDNIFFNARSNAGATGKNYAVRVGGTTVNPTGLTSNNNVSFANGTGAVFGFYNALDVANLAAWQAATGQDFGSFSLDPKYLAPAAATPDLHIDPGVATPIEANGALIAAVTDDFDGQTRSGLTPTDIGADAGNFIGVDLSAPAIVYTAFSNTSSVADRTLTPTLTDLTGVATGGLAPRIYYRKNAGAYFSQACGLSSGTVNNGTWSCVIVNSDMGGVATGDIIGYYVIAQDTAGNVGSNPAGVTATDVNTVTTPPTPNTYAISIPYSGSYTVDAGGAITSLTNAGGIFELLNAGVLTGNVTVNVASDLIAETGTVALNQLSEEPVGSNFTVTFQSSAATLRTVSGTSANSLIRLNGADRVTFDGRVGGSGQFLLLRNVNTLNPTIGFLNDATLNTIESCIVESGNTSTTSGTILFSTSTGTAGNSNNTVHANDLRDRSDAAGVPANAVFSSGSVGAPNASNTVANNKIYNWTNAGVLLSATGIGDTWQVNQNDLYQPNPRTTAMTGISIQGGNNHTVSSNNIGGTAAGAGGSNLATSQTFRGIDLTVGTTTATSVQGNVIKNIRSTLAGSFTSSYGIFLQAGRANIGTVAGNTIGSANVAERYEISGDSYGIRVISTSTVIVSNNTVNNFTTAPGVPTGEFYFGMSIEGTAGAHTVANNTITNITNGSTPDASFNTQTIGINVAATGIQTIRGNTISNVGVTSTAVPTTLNNRIWGLIVSATAVGTVVDRNSISGLYGSVTTTGARSDVITGIQSQSTANATFTNNMVSLNGGADSDRPIFAILDLSATPAISNYYFNSANVYGTSTGTNATYAFNRNSTATVSIHDNIFVNTRAELGGFNIAMANSNAAATGWSTTASDNNRLHNVNSIHLTQWLASVMDLPTFQSVAQSGGDAATTSGDPLFVSDSNLHLQASSPVKAAGVPFGGVTVDFDNEPRSATTPAIGADELVTDLSITKTDGVTTANAGGSVTYTIVASNLGPNAASATVTDTFPAALTSCSTTCVGGGGATCTAGPTVGNLSDTASLPVGGTATYTAVCSVSLAATGSLANTATVSSATADPTAGNNSATDTDTIVPAADLDITKTDGVTTATPGGSVTYTITVTNNGPATATGATVADTFPAFCTSHSFTSVAAGGATGNTAGPDAGDINDTVTMPSGSSVTYTASCNISGAASGNLVNTATVTAPGTVVDPTPGNNSATDTDALGAQADLQITKTDGVTTATAGGSVTYTIVASNAGPSAAPGSIVADVFPAACTSHSFTSVAAGGATGNTAGPSAANINDTLNLPVGSSVTYTASCTISGSATVSISNTATIAAGAGVVDPNPANNSATDADAIGNSLFADGFENGTTSAWSISSSLTFENTATLPVTSAAMSFDYDLSAIPTGKAIGPTAIATLRDAASQSVVMVAVRRIDASAPLELRLLAADRASSWTEVAEGRQQLRLEWTATRGKAVTFALSLDGRLGLWLDGFAPTGLPVSAQVKSSPRMQE